jgi:Tol biopolymer transport system component
LNVAVTRLRQALGDSADKPRYIETLAKRGYRFRGLVQSTPKPSMDKPVAPATVDRQPFRVPVYWALAAILLGAVGLFLAIHSRSAASPAETGRSQAQPLTAFQGNESSPALSPDGSRIAFSWNGIARDNADIFVMSTESGDPVRLTTHAADEVSPAWSPNGNTIVFLRRLEDDRGELIVKQASGGPEHKVAEIRNHELTSGRNRLLSLAWLPDGEWIVASHRAGSEKAESLYLFSLTGKSRRVTMNPMYGDQSPAVSPDGRQLAFSRMLGFSASEIYCVALTEGPEAAARPLTSHKGWSVNPAWMPDGKQLLYVKSKEPTGRHELRLMSAITGAASESTIPLEDDAVEITLRRHLVYSHLQRDTNIWRARVPRRGEPPSKPEMFLPSTRNDDKAVYSPNGENVAFTSTRSGSPELWLADANGGSARRLTSFGGALMGKASWSPDGQWLTFHARPEGQADAFVMPSIGGKVRRLTMDATDDTMPSYSQDGQWIYYTGTQTGRSEIWKIPAGGGRPLQLTTTGGQRPVEAPDGRTVVYMTLGGRELRSVPVDGGESTLIVAPLHPYPTGFAVTPRGIYYAAPPHDGDLRYVMWMSLSGAERRPIALAHSQFYLGLSVSPDEKHILFDQTDQFDRDLLIVRDFVGRK